MSFSVSANCRQDCSLIGVSPPLPDTPWFARRSPPLPPSEEPPPRPPVAARIKPPDHRGNREDRQHPSREDRPAQRGLRGSRFRWDRQSTARRRRSPLRDGRRRSLRDRRRRVDFGGVPRDGWRWRRRARRALRWVPLSVGCEPPTRFVSRLPWSRRPGWIHTAPSRRPGSRVSFTIAPGTRAVERRAPKGHPRRWLLACWSVLVPVPALS